MKTSQAFSSIASTFTELDQSEVARAFATAYEAACRQAAEDGAAPGETLNALLEVATSAARDFTMDTIDTLGVEDGLVKKIEQARKLLLEAASIYATLR